MTFNKKIILKIVVCLFCCTFGFLFCKWFSSPTISYSTSNQQELSFIYDDEYMQEIEQANSNYGLCKVNDEYSQKYKELIEIYYQKIYEKVGANLKQVIAEERASWNQYAQTRLNRQIQYYELIYGGGSIVPVLCAEAEYEMYREKALELFQMYEELDSGTGDGLREPG